MKECLLIDKWAKDGLIKNLVAGVLAISSGKKVLDNYNKKIEDRPKSKTLNDDSNIKEAA